MEIKLIEAGTFEKGKLRLQYVTKIEQRMETEMTMPIYYKWHVADCQLSYGPSCAKCSEFDSRIFRVETREVRGPEFSEDFEAALLGPKPIPGMSDEAHRLEMLFRLWKQLMVHPQLPIPLVKDLHVHLAEF